MMIPPISFISLVILTTLHRTHSLTVPPSCVGYNNAATRPTFVDKSGLLYAFLSHERHHEYINAPSGFGKTTNLHMLNCFLNLQLDHEHKPINSNETYAHQTFKGKAIWPNSAIILPSTQIVEKYLAKVPVINLNLSFSFDPADIITDQLILSKLNANLKECFREYSWLPLATLNATYKPIVEAGLAGTMSKKQIEDALITFSRVLTKHFNRKPILLVDDYDSLFSYLIQYGDEVQEGYNVINKMIESAIDQFNVDSVDYSFMVGISSVPVFSAGSLVLHIFHEEFTIAHRFAPYFGLTDHEVGFLLDKYGCSEEERENITRNYGNYAIRNGSLYIPNSVAQYLENRNTADTSLKLYWKPTTSINLLFFFYDVPSFSKHVLDILSGEFPVKLQIDTSLVTFKALRYLASNITNATDESDDSVLHPMLLEQGYLTRTGELNMYQLPNLEAYHSLNNNVVKYYAKHMNDTQHLRKYIPKI